jgi:hypothetical protein
MTEPTLREHLAEIISYTGYATRNLDSVISAKTLGVLPELVDEAKAMAAKRREVAKFNHESFKLKKKSAAYKSKTWLIDFPGGSWDAWLACCEQRKLKPTTFVLSVLHAYLMGSYEPVIETKHWIIKGEVYPRSRKYFHQLKVNITKSMHEALVERVKAHGDFGATGVTRALLCDVMNGKFCRPGTFEVVKRARVFTDRGVYIPRSVDPEQPPQVRLVDAYEQYDARIAR